jgi:hypothetical protein
MDTPFLSYLPNPQNQLRYLKIYLATLDIKYLRGGLQS